jgi:hypothetical protein
MGDRQFLAFCTIALALLAASCSSYERHVARQLDQFEKVNAGQPGGRVIIPVNQVLTPLGIQVELPRMRPQAIALSPDGKILATSGNTSELVLVNPETGDIIQRLDLPSEQATNAGPSTVSTHILAPDKDAQLSYTGLIFSKDGKRIYLSNVNGSVKVFALANGSFDALQSFPLPPAGLEKRKEEIPAGLALSADGWKTTLRRSQSFQSPPGTRRQQWNLPARLRSRCGTLRCRSARQQSVCEQLGRQAAGRDERYRPRRARNESAG